MRKPLTAVGKHQELRWRGWLGGVWGGSMGAGFSIRGIPAVIVQKWLK